MTNLLEPVEKTFIDTKGKPHKFFIGKVPWLSGGRRVLAEYIPTGMPMVGNYEANEELARILYANVVAVDAEGNEFPLTTDSQINQRASDVKVAMELEAAVFDKSTDFLILGKVLEYRTAWSITVESVLANLPTQLQNLLSALEKPATKTSKKKSVSKAPT